MFAGLPSLRETLLQKHISQKLDEWEKYTGPNNE